MTLEKSYLPQELTGEKKVPKVALLPLLKEIFPELNKLERFSELSLIELAPEGKIGWHRHTEDKEWWIIISRKGIYIRHCPCGSGHELSNDTGDVIYIVAIKWLVSDKDS